MTVHFSSNRQDWATPAYVFNPLNEEFNFRVDVCASFENRKVTTYFTEKVDGLKVNWHEYEGPFWMNPPYGQEIGKWMNKAYEEALKGCLVVCLVPARTDTAWWHDYAMKGEIRYVRGRIKFEGARHSAPFPSAIVVFDPETLKTSETEAKGL